MASTSKSEKTKAWKHTANTVEVIRNIEEVFIKTQVRKLLKQNNFKNKKFQKTKLHKLPSRKLLTTKMIMYSINQL